MHPERTAFWFGLQIRTGRILQDLMNFQLVWAGEGLFRHSAGLCMTLHELVRAHPVQKILAAIPGSENHVWVAIIYRTQDLVGNKTGHAIHQSGAFAKPLFERIAVFRRDIDSIGDSYHCEISLWLDDTR